MTMGDEGFFELAKEYAKAEKELKIEEWVFVSIEYRNKDGEYIKLHKYDIPRRMQERYEWVFRWRAAQLQCKYPRECIRTYYSYYDKRTGLSLGFDSDLSQLRAAKAQITLAEKREQEYIEYKRENDMFFDEQTDEQLRTFRAKLQAKMDKYVCLYARLEQKVKQTKENGTNGA